MFGAFTLAIRPCKKNLNPKLGFPKTRGFVFSKLETRVLTKSSGFTDPTNVVMMMMMMMVFIMKSFKVPCVCVCVCVIM